MNKLKDKALVVLSGGQDSTTCLYWALQKFNTVCAVTFDYGQTHACEISAAKIIAARAGVECHEIIELGAGILKSTSPLVSDNKLEQYKDHASLPGGLEKTFVPMRNQLFLTVAANRAFALGCADLVTGVCQEDSGGYPDCRQNFISSFETTSTLGTFNKDANSHPLRVHTPLMFLTKAESIDMAVSLPGCMASLAYSHTSYDGKYPPTGHDHATLLRAKGFEEAGMADPLVMRAYREGLMDLPDTPNYRFDND